MAEAEHWGKFHPHVHAIAASGASISIKYNSLTQPGRIAARQCEGQVRYAVLAGGSGVSQDSAKTSFAIFVTFVTFVLHCEADERLCQGCDEESPWHVNSCVVHRVHRGAWSPGAPSEELQLFDLFANLRPLIQASPSAREEAIQTEIVKATKGSIANSEAQMFQAPGALPGCVMDGTRNHSFFWGGYKFEKYRNLTRVKRHEWDRPRPCSPVAVSQDVTS